MREGGVREAYLLGKGAGPFLEKGRLERGRAVQRGACRVMCSMEGGGATGVTPWRAEARGDARLGPMEGVALRSAEGQGLASGPRPPVWSAPCRAQGACRL